MEFTRPKQLLAYDIPAALREDLRKVTKGTRKDFVRTFNATIWGQVDNLDQVILGIGIERGHFDDVANYEPVIDILWRRLREVAKYYNITN